MLPPLEAAALTHMLGGLAAVQMGEVAAVAVARRRRREVGSERVPMEAEVQAVVYGSAEAGG